MQHAGQTQEKICEPGFKVQTATFKAEDTPILYTWTRASVIAYQTSFI